jgi:hypothetical protein
MMKKPTLEEEDTIIEVKQDFIVSPSSHSTQSTLRTAYFLKSIASFILNPPAPPISSSVFCF